MELENAAALETEAPDAPAAAVEVLVRLTTSIDRLRVPSVPIAVPTSLNKHGLSKVVQHLLGSEAEDLDLEFFVPPVSASSGSVAVRKPLRGTLGKHLTSIGLSHEMTVTLEYTLPVPAPRTQRPEPQNDWIGAIDGGERLYAAGSYDGTLSVHSLAGCDSSGVVGGGGISRVVAHAGAVSSLHLLELATGAAAGSQALLATAGHDAVVRLWFAAVSAAGPDAAGAAAVAAPPASAAKAARGGSRAAAVAAATPAPSVRLAAELRGASGPISCARLAPSCALVAAGDAAGNLLLWRVAARAATVAVPAPLKVAAATAPPVASAKRPRRERSASTSSQQPLAKTTGASAASEAAAAMAEPAQSDAPCAQVLGAHAGGPLTGVTWLSATTLATCGLDACIRTWEVEEEEEGEGKGSAGHRLSLSRGLTLSALKPVLALTSSPMGSLLASAHTDGAVRVWSSRGGAGAADGEGAKEAGGGVTALADGLRVTLPVYAALAPQLARLAAAAVTSAPVGGAGGAGAAGPASSSNAGAWLAGVSWCPTSAHHVAVASHQGGAVSVWDVRAPAAPLFLAQRHAPKAGVAAVPVPVAAVPEGSAADAPAAPPSAANAAAAATAATAAAAPTDTKALCVAWAGAVEPAQAGAGGAVGAAQAPPQMLISGGSDQCVRVSVFLQLLQ